MATKGSYRSPVDPSVDMAFKGNFIGLQAVFQNLEYARLLSMIRSGFPFQLLTYDSWVGPAMLDGMGIKITSFTTRGTISCTDDPNAESVNTFEAMVEELEASVEDVIGSSKNIRGTAVDLCHQFGVTYDYCRKILAGKVAPSADRYLRIADWRVRFEFNGMEAHEYIKYTLKEWPDNMRNVIGTLKEYGWSTVHLRAGSAWKDRIANAVD